MEKSVGFTIGKFAPLHKGHEFLISTGIKEMDEFYVVIYDTDITKVDINRRTEWIKRLFPTVKIIQAFNSPKQYGLDDESVKIQMEYLSNLVKSINPTSFYSCEPYGEKVAEYLKINNRIVDLNKEHIPISATFIRKNLEKNKEYLERFVYEDIKIMEK